MNDTNPKKQLIDKLQKVTNILVTVSRNPDVDQLTAALALTLVLDKMKKHSTAVFSGQIPPVMNFLEPEKTFEDNADSLRDFIISLDKNKADRLRMKTDGNIVKILVTPYRTKITPDDINFSEGEFNVELVIAVGVENKADLDTVLTAHGRIFHDATVATINLREGQDMLGSISWFDANANSYSEMITVLTNELGSDGSLMDEQISTALLTGIVATTDQFRNEQTTPTIMKMAAELMTSGANQQLIASELSAADVESENVTTNPTADEPVKDEFTEVLDIDKTPVEEPVVEEVATEEPAPTPPAEPAVAEESAPETPAPGQPAPESEPAPEPTPAQPVETAPPSLTEMLDREKAELSEQNSEEALSVAEAQILESDLTHTLTNIEPPTDNNTPTTAPDDADKLGSFADNPTLKFSDPTTSPTVDFPPVIPGSLPTMPIDNQPSTSTIPPSLDIPLPPPPPLPPMPDINALPPTETPVAPDAVAPAPMIGDPTPPAEPEIVEDKVPDIMEFQIPTQ